MDALEKAISAQNALYQAIGLEILNFTPERESADYHAHSYQVGNQNVRFRIAKKTPTKTGWFVTFWKRGADAVIAPYDVIDPIDMLIVNVIEEDRVGHFVFPKSILLEKGIISRNGQGGKRAMRVYTPWDEAKSMQATRTQKWQAKFFVDMCSQDSKRMERFKSLYAGMTIFF